MTGGGGDGAAAAPLRCPHCGAALSRAASAWRCPAGHSFDVARQGYVNLTTGRAAHPGDTPAMLDARAGVLAAGHLDLVADAVLADVRADLPAGALVEVGAGTAHHLARLRRALGERPAVALDASVAAAKRAARADPAWTTAVVADAWAPWPLLDRSASLVLVAFAPRNPPEAARVLVDRGELVVVTPGADHLVELVGPLGLLGMAAGKGERVAADAAPHLDLVGDREVRAERLLDRSEAGAMALMGPSGHHLDPGALARRVDALPPVVPVTVAVRIQRFRPRR